MQFLIFRQPNPNLAYNEIEQQFWIHANTFMSPPHPPPPPVFFSYQLTRTFCHDVISFFVLAFLLGLRMVRSRDNSTSTFLTLVLCSTQRVRARLIYSKAFLTRVTASGTSWAFGATLWSTVAKGNTLFSRLTAQMCLNRTWE